MDPVILLHLNCWGAFLVGMFHEYPFEECLQGLIMADLV